MKVVTKEMINAYVSELYRSVTPDDMEVCTELREEQPALFAILDNMAVTSHDQDPEVTRNFVNYIHMLYKLLKRANDDDI